MFSRIRPLLTQDGPTVALLLGLMTLLPGPAGGDNSGGTREYCQEKTFEARCGVGEAILMTSAHFGRKSIWKCVDETFGLGDCTRDALRLMDSKCSGHRECEMSIMDPDFRALKPCPKDVTWHLLASFECVKVNIRPIHECQKRSNLHIQEASGFLSSEVAMTTGAGSSMCPWEITAPAGQTINITLYNFMYNTINGGQIIGTPSVTVATLHDPENAGLQRIQAFGNRLRFVSTYVSHGNRLKVTFADGVTPGNQAAVKNRTQFLLKYEFVGCSDLLPPDGAEVVRNGPSVEVKCAATGETWFLTCENNHWSGKLGNCSRALSKKSWTDEIFQNDDNFPFGILVVVAVGVALGIFLGGTLLLVVSIYMKRRHTRHDPHTMQYEGEPHAFHGAPLPEDYYTKQELTELEQQKEETLRAQHGTGRMTSEEYKITEYRPAFSSQMSYSTGTHPAPPRNMHHVYESPKFA